jgi:hypothetical protein
MQSASAIVGGNVTLSAPFDAVRADMVAIPLGNLTDASVPQGIVSARYVSLTISGSYGTDDYGGTVAEFAVLGA